MPVIYIYAINTTGGKDPKLYESPIYRKPGRKEVIHTHADTHTRANTNTSTPISYVHKN